MCIRDSPGHHRFKGTVVFQGQPPAAVSLHQDVVGLQPGIPALRNPRDFFAQGVRIARQYRPALPGQGLIQLLRGGRGTDLRLIAQMLSLIHI